MKTRTLEILPKMMFFINNQIIKSRYMFNKINNKIIITLRKLEEKEKQLENGLIVPLGIISRIFIYLLIISILYIWFFNGNQIWNTPFVQLTLNELIKLVSKIIAFIFIFKLLIDRFIKFPSLINREVYKSWATGVGYLIIIVIIALYLLNRF